MIAGMMSAFWDSPLEQWMEFMKISLDGIFEFEFFELEDTKKAEQFAESIDGEVYSWKTVGYSNWLEKRLSVADTLGLVVIPKGLPDWIDLPDDSGK
jgi:hypothetical protein